MLLEEYSTCVPFKTAFDKCPKMLTGPIEFSPDDPHMLSAIGKLRVKAWKARQPAFPDMAAWIDGFDHIARHWVILADGSPVAAARMTVHAVLSSVPNAEIFAGSFPEGLSGPIASINRLVVDPAFSGTGLSRVLDEIRISAARKMSCANIVVETFANTPRVPALEALGFEVMGFALPYATGPLAIVKHGKNEQTPGPATALRLALRFAMDPSEKRPEPDMKSPGPA